MKAEDLMIGDWYYWEAEGKMYPYQVTAEDFVKGEIPNFQSVPLTEEILEKNGLTSVEDPYNHKKYFLLGKNEYNCNVYWDGLVILLVDEDCYEPITYTYVCDVKYVHELQHALKLYGIEKEIVL